MYVVEPTNITNFEKCDKNFKNRMKSCGEKNGEKSDFFIFFFDFE